MDYGARRSATDDGCDEVGSASTGVFIGTGFIGAFVGIAMTLCSTRPWKRKKDKKKVTPVISDDDDDESEDEEKGEESEEETRGAESTGESLSLHSVLALKQIARNIKRKAGNLAELRARQEAELQAFETAERRKRIDAIKELPYEEDAMNDNGLVHELAMLKQLHFREVQAIDTYFGFKKEIAMLHLQDAHEMRKRDGEGNESELGDDATRAEAEEEAIEKELTKVENRVKQDEMLRQMRQVRDVKGDTETYRLELERLKEALDVEMDSLMDSIDVGQKKKREWLKSTIEGSQANSDLELAEAEIELALASFDLTALQHDQRMQRKERRRRLIVLGETVDADQEVAWLEELHVASRKALDRLLDAEEARRRLKLKARHKTRKEQVGAILAKKGVNKGDNEFIVEMQKIDEEAQSELGALEEQLRDERTFYTAQFNDRLQLGKNQSNQFNDQLRQLREEHLLRSKQLEEELRNDHHRRSALLMERVAARRAKKALELELRKASPEEIDNEMQDLQELDLQELNTLQAELAQSVAATVSEEDNTQHDQLRELVQEDEEVQVLQTNEENELRRLIEKQLKSRIELEKNLEARRRSAGAKLKMYVDNTFVVLTCFVI